MSSELSTLFEEYASYHRHPMNKLCHYVGVPLIIVTVVGLLSKVSLGLAVPATVAAVLYDLRFSVRLTLPFAALIAVSFLVTSNVPGWVLWAGFVVGWIFQLVGHYVYEKKTPAFLENLQQLLVGPLWLISEALPKRLAARDT